MYGIIAMKDLFNMTAGTSTGSILAAGLAYPEDRSDLYPNDIKKGETTDTPRFYGDDLLKIYETKRYDIFQKKSVHWYFWLFWILVFVGLKSYLGWYFGLMYFDNPKRHECYGKMVKQLENKKA